MEVVSITATTVELSPSRVPLEAGIETPVPDTEDRAKRLQAMRESRQKRKDDEWLLVREALAVIDRLPLDDDDGD